VPEDSDNLPHIYTENVPECFKARLDELIEKHHKLWNGCLGLTKATEHRIKLEHRAKPVSRIPLQTQRSSEVPGYAASTESSRQRASDPDQIYPIVDNSNSNQNVISQAVSRRRTLGIQRNLLRGSLAQFCVNAKKYTFGMIIVNFYNERTEWYPDTNSLSPGFFGKRL